MIDIGIVFAHRSSCRAFNLIRRNYHGQENLEESEEAGSGETLDDCWRRTGISKRFCSTRAGCLFAGTGENDYRFEGLPPKGWQPFLLHPVSFS